ncbi:MAG: hypothetical protein M0Z71_12570, partial [Nitrospiraceae bacterium]|nr:hypothetical protein [Nitrospiraceae bacterium]
MALLNYKKQFAPLVESGEKKQTIRAMRKYPIKEGETLYHYTGCRTKQARKLKVSKCTGAFNLVITIGGNIYVEGAVMMESMKRFFAHADGFRGTADLSEWGQMLHFFRTVHGLPFEGQLILWDQPVDSIREYIKRHKIG